MISDICPKERRRADCASTKKRTERRRRSEGQIDFEKRILNNEFLRVISE